MVLVLNKYLFHAINSEFIFFINYLLSTSIKPKLRITHHIDIFLCVTYNLINMLVQINANFRRNKFFLAVTIEKTIDLMGEPLGIRVFLNYLHLITLFLVLDLDFVFEIFQCEFIFFCCFVDVSVIEAWRKGSICLLGMIPCLGQYSTGLRGCWSFYKRVNGFYNFCLF
jgi:hypothetical protein